MITRDITKADAADFALKRWMTSKGMSDEFVAQTLVPFLKEELGVAIAANDWIEVAELATYISVLSVPHVDELIETVEETLETVGATRL